MSLQAKGRLTGWLAGVERISDSVSLFLSLLCLPFQLIMAAVELQKAA